MTQSERKHVLSARILSGQEQHVSEHAVWFCDKAKEICVRADRFALAHYFNVLSRYNNSLSLLLLHRIHILHTHCRQSTCEPV